jgi:glutamine synthetase
MADDEIPAGIVQHELAHEGWLPDTTRRLVHRGSGVRRFRGLPGNPLDASRELGQCRVLRKASGRTPASDYLDYFIEVKRGECQQAHEQINPWERHKHLELF